ncbi:MAG: hypothetical protein WD708_07810 [Kiritimatiellia bacterium]
MNPPPSDPLRELPASIANTLDTAALRIRRILFLRGLFAVLAIALICFLAVMAVDAAVLLFSDKVRWLLSLTAFSVIAVSVYRLMIRPLRRRLTPAEIARVIETRNEGLSDERISSAVEILSMHQNTSGEFSRSLLDRLVQDAETDSKLILPDQLFTLRSAKRFIIALGGVAALYLVLFILWPQTSARLFVRAVAPYARVDGRQADRISITPGDVRMVAGDPLSIQVKLHEEIRGAVELRTRTPEEPERIERMQARAGTEGSADLFTTRFPRVTEDFEYRVRADRTLSKFHRVRVFPRPEITKLHLLTDYPDYTEHESGLTAGPPERITALIGSTLTLSIETNVALANAKLFLGEDDLGEGTVTTRNRQSVRQWRVSVGAPAETRRWRVEMESKEGFTNHPRHHDLVVTEDRAPVVTRIHPARSRIQLPPDGFVPLRYEVEEDFGVSKVELHLEVDGGSTQIKPQALPETAGAMWTGVIPLNLAALNLGNARTVKASIQVFDTLPEDSGGPNRGISEALTIALTDDSESLSRQSIDEDRKLAARSLEQIIADLERLQESSETLQDKTRSEMEESEPEAAALAADIRRELGRVDAEVLTLSRSLQGRFLNSVSAVLAGVSQDPLREAQRLSQTYSLHDERPAKLEITTSLQTEIQQALDELRQAQTQLDPLANAAERLADLIDIQHQQEQQVDETQQTDWANQLEEWRQRQEELAAQLAAVTEQDQALQDLGEKAREAEKQLTEAAEKAETAAQLAENFDTPPWLEAQLAAQSAQQAAESAQQNAAKAQEAASRAQEAASKADTPETSQKAAEAAAEAQDNTEQAQTAAEQAQQQAAEAQQAAEQAQREAGLERAAEAQREAIQSQQEAQTAQQKAQEQQQAAEQAQQQAAETGTPEAQQAASEAQEGATESQQAAAEAQQQARARQEQAVNEAIQEAVQTGQGQQLQEAVQAGEEAHQAAEQAAEATAEAAQTAAEAGLNETAEKMAELAESGQAAAAQLAEAAANPAAPKAAQAMADSADQLQQAAQAMQAMTPAAPSAEQLARAESTQAAQAAAAEAAQAAAEGDAEQAAQQAAAAAKQLQQQNQAMAQAMGLPESATEPGQMPSPPGPSGDEAGEGEALVEGPQSEEVPEWAMELGLFGEDWIRMRGETGRTGEAMEDSSIPAEYRGLVRDYFRQLSRE